MSKTFSRIITIMLLLVLIGASVMVFITFASMGQNIVADTGYSVDQKPLYHFMVIINGTDESYVSILREGIDLGAEYYDVTYEFWDISDADTQEAILQQFDIGVYSEVDGIIVETYNNEAFQEVMEKAYEKGIPVVSINEDITNAKKISHMELNQYSVGSRVGSAINLAGLEHGTIIVLQNENLLYDDRAKGIYDYLSGDYNVDIEIIENQGQNIINAEELTKQILSDNDDIKAIVCNDSNVTMGVISAVKDTNNVGNILVIGYGFNDDIQGFIEKEVVYATVIVEYRHLGYSCIEALVKEKRGNFVSDYASVNVEILTKENLQEYLDREGLLDETTPE